MFVLAFYFHCYFVAIISVAILVLQSVWQRTVGRSDGGKLANGYTRAFKYQFCLKLAKKKWKIVSYWCNYNTCKIWQVGNHKTIPTQVSWVYIKKQTSKFYIFLAIISTSRTKYLGHMTLVNTLTEMAMHLQQSGHTSKVYKQVSTKFKERHLAHENFVPEFRELRKVTCMKVSMPLEGCCWL